MKRFLYAVIGVVVFGVGAFFIFKMKDRATPDDYFFETEGQSDDRIKSLNLDKATEDVSYILDTNKLSFPHLDRNKDIVEYKADPEREWVINLIQINGGLFDKRDLSKLFDYEWRSQFESEIYGLSTVDKKWTYAFSGDSLDTYSQIQIAMNLQRLFEEEKPKYDPKKLELCISELKRRIEKYPTKLRFEQTESIADAISKAQRFVELHKEFDRDAILVLQGDKVYNGAEAWDVLLSIGLKWGDGDLFHWNNSSHFGSDQHFSVWTTTQPNYFLPEEIKEGQMNPENLVFGFSVPRSADPQNIFDIMISSVRYAQKRLGGRILNGDGNPFNENIERKKIVEFVNRMKAKGMTPGSEKALVMY